MTCDVLRTSCLRHDAAVLTFALAILTVPAAGATEGLEGSVEVLGHVVLTEMHVDGLSVGEVSGLERSAHEGRLFGVTDRGTLLTFDLSYDERGLYAVTPLSAAPLHDAQGRTVGSEAFDPEALELEGRAGVTQLLIASETGPAAALFDTSGRWVAAVAPPKGLADDPSLEQLKRGVEAAAVHPDHGLLMALEEPPSGTAPGVHVIHASDGSSFSFAGREIGDSRLKAMEVLEDGRVVLLERAKGPTKGSLVPYLQVLDPAECAGDGLCPTAVARIDVPGVVDADYEGLADLGNGLLLVASDDKVDGELRTVFVLLRLQA